MKKLIVIGGPTASGKTSLSVELAKSLNCPIISADSRQFYKELSIGTAKPSLEEQDGVKHYFIHSHHLNNPISSGEYEKEVISLLDQIFKNSDYAILTGGSGLFIDAVLFGIDDIPKDDNVKVKLNEKFEKEGIEVLLEELKEKDPHYFNQVDKNNSHRVIRALEAIEVSGKSFTELRTNQKKTRNFDSEIFIIHHERESLYNRINQRVELMVEAGLFDEVKHVEEFRHLQSLNTVGYKEVFSYFDGEISQNECIELIKRNTRRYAKRQITWFKRYKDAHWLNYKCNEDMLEEIRCKVL